MNLITLTELYGTDPASNFQNTTFIVDFTFSILFVLLFTVFFAVQINRALIWVFYAVLDVLFIVAFAFGLNVLGIICLVLIAAGSILFAFINAGILRKYVVKPSKINVQSKPGYDKDLMIKKLVEAVNWLSSNKVGALITFERDTNLNEFMKNGTIINCPISPEIIETIFYEGTRLHDGAIIIRGDTIVAAAVYYPPSTRPQTGKFGARHRAALGISEVTDAVTIIVSEETGRISITHGGLIDSVKTDEFEKIFRYLLSDQKETPASGTAAPVKTQDKPADEEKPDRDDSLDQTTMF
jgi:diadenylate cyclase